MFTLILHRVALTALFLFAAFSVFTALPVFAASVDDFSTDKSKGTLVFDHALPNVPGKSMKAVLIEYQPGGSIPAHTHPDSSFIYATVLEGAIRSKVNDDPEQVYYAGESFVELPGAHHGVSTNVSETEPARLLAVFVIDTDEKNLATNDKDSQGTLNRELLKGETHTL
ncbi:MAG: cupin domain-containing protein [Scytonema sp. PMC 1069.18]|nr:cupin domain-containing protein [Scytonema sp. PMC 1069.18]MEC4885983.1 cupin domain-containing protein [Scytonema sp. PMC 1070.18]